MPPISGANISEGFLPLPPAIVFAGIATVIPRRFSIKTFDEPTMSCTFRTSATLFGWGETLTARVVPAEAGAILRVGPAAVHARLSARTMKLLDKCVADLIAHLMAQGA